MLELLFNYFHQLFYVLFEDINGNLPMNEIVFTLPNDVNGTMFCLGEYLALLASIISLVIIIILCCSFIGKLIKVVARLFMGA